MARYYGAIGFIRTEDDGTGIWEEKETVRHYYGDLNSNVRKWNQQNDVGSNDTLSLNNNISILADRFAYDNLDAMKWAEFQGIKWRITSVEINYPRMTLFFGGVWNGVADEGGLAVGSDGYSRFR